MRALFLLPLFVAASSLSLAQKREGIYRPEGATPANWRINDHHTLLWDGHPYLPFGIRSSGMAAELAAAKEAGIGDVILELPAGGAGWSSAVAAAENQGMRYMVAINSLAPMAKGFAVEPQGYRVANITQKQQIDVNIPGATSAFVVLITRRDSAVEKTWRVPLKDGQLVMEVDPANDLEHTLLIYPETTSLQQTDYWEAFDEHRDLLLRSIKQAKFGSGLRGFINPVGSVLSLTSARPLFVPSSPFFRTEYRSYLENKYKNIETIQRTWSLRASDLASFDDFARLVPLWSDTRGIPMVWDPKTDKLYTCENRRSTVWSDIDTVIGAAAARRYQRLARSIRLLVDVPVVQEWSGWSAQYEISNPPMDGLGMRVSGTSPSAVAAAASRVTSSVLRWTDRGWLVATDIDLTSKESAAQLSNLADDLVSLGARGWFFRVTAETLPLLKDEAAKRTSDTSAASWSPRALYFPENAMNPAMPQRLAGGNWWLPSPANGNRIDFGSRFFGYRYQDGQTQFIALWTSDGATRVKLRMADPKSATFASSDGSDPKPKVVKNGVEVTLNEYPLIVSGTSEIPVPEPAFLETTARFDQLLKMAEAEQKDTTEEGFFFRDALTSFERNPGGSFGIMRTQFWKLNAKLGRFSWVEAESSGAHNYSEVFQQPGVSGGAVLALRTSLVGANVGTYSAELFVPIKTSDEVEVWLAARIPTDLRGNVRVVLGGQVLTLEGEPVARYGQGFGWYKLGVTSLKGGSTRARVDVTAPNGADMAIDTLVLAPAGFRPSGVTQPDGIAYVGLP